MADALGEWFDELAAGGIFITDADLRIRAWNRWLAMNVGRRPAEVVGLPLFDAFPELVARGLDQYYRDALAGEARVVAYRFHGHLLAVATRGSREDCMPQSARIAPLRVGGRVVGTITMIENVTERVMTERELRSQIGQLERARTTAEAAVRTKDEFLATLSHELRTPLNAILGWTRLMRSGQMDQSTFARALDVIDRNATAQAQLIDDILDVARVMQGKLRLEMQPADLAPVVLAAIDVIRPSALAKRIALATRIECESALVTGDPNRLQQVVWNLLSNAVKFTPPEGRIDVSLSVTGAVAEVIVKDTGKGIASEFLPHVFDRFRQEDSTTTRRYGGLGLGLSLVRQLVELHGGGVRAESGGEGAGAIFSVTLPLRDVAPASRRAAPPDEEVSVTGRRILLVEDEPDAREVLSAALVRLGARVVAASSSADAYQTLVTAPACERPEVIIADIAMPDEDGYSLLSRVRRLPEDRGGSTPAIAVTGYAGQDARNRAFDAGFQLHFAKPIDPTRLAAAVARLLGVDSTADA
jgi:PAS domain S-box-containing protein